MTIESMRERFEAWHLNQLELGGGFFYEKETVFEAWQAATLADRERCAKVCEELANLMESGAGEKEPGHRLRQAARNIRKDES